MVPNYGPYQMQNGYNTLNYMSQPQPNGYPMGVMGQQNPPVVQMPQVQQPMMAQQMGGQAMVLGGKPVDSVEVVKATDIPMDNATYYFPKPDGTEIYTKRWTQDGDCKIDTYRRDPEPPFDETKQFMDGFLCKDDVMNMQANLLQKMDSILERVSKLEEAFK